MVKLSGDFSCTKFIVRTAIVVCYLFIIAFFLYFSRLKNVFFKDTSLYIYAYADMITFDAIREFEETYGIKVSMKYFDTDEELFAKFKINRGEGYDLITPSDYMVELLRKENLLSPLDYTKLPIVDELDLRLLKHYYDPDNTYSLPLAWMVHGIVYNKKIFKSPQDNISMDLVFEGPNFYQNEIVFPYRICMIENVREAVSLASIYLFGSAEKLSDKKIEIIKKLLINQRQWVESYLHQELRYFLLAQIFHAAITLSSYVRNLIKEDSNFEFKIPAEGSLLTIQNLAIPAASKNKERVYLFINFLLSRKIATLNSQYFGYNPTNKISYQDVDKRFLRNNNLFPNDKTFAKLHLLHNNWPMQKLNDMWLQVKSS